MLVYHQIKVKKIQQTSNYNSIVTCRLLMYTVDNLTLSNCVGNNKKEIFA